MARLVRMHDHLAGRRPTTGEAGPRPARVAGGASRPEPPPGTLLFIEFPRSLTGQDAALLYTVATCDHAGRLTARAVVGWAPLVRAETPCLVHCHVGEDDVTLDALALSSAGSDVVLHLNTADARQRPRPSHAMPLSVEVPGTNFGVVSGVTDDISLGGMCARLAVPLPPARRVFLSLHPPQASPIVALARMVSCDASGADGYYLARFEYTIMAAWDQARLWALVESPPDDPGR